MALEIGRKPLFVPTGVPQLLSAIVHERTGIFFEPERLDVLVEKIQPLAEARECYSLLDYYYLLKYEENGTEDWEQVLDALSVQETYFWREMPQIRAVVDILVPQWFKSTSAPLRIWSAACATGEEPFTLVMALAEAGWGNHPIEINASDGSLSALARARAGIYREKSFRMLPEGYREKYFSAVPGGWQIRPEVSRKVRFERANLLAAEEINPLARASIVFCRNVFIYFSPHAIRLTLASFASRMPSKSWLFVGASESLLKMTADFQLKEIGDAFGYIRV